MSITRRASVPGMNCAIAEEYATPRVTVPSAARAAAQRASSRLR